MTPWMQRLIRREQLHAGLYDMATIATIGAESARDLERLAAETARTDPWTAATNLFGEHR